MNLKIVQQKPILNYHKLKIFTKFENTMKNLKKLILKENLRREEDGKDKLTNKEISIAFFGIDRPTKIHNLIERKAKNIPKGNFKELCTLLNCTLDELIY